MKAFQEIQAQLAVYDTHRMSNGARIVYAGNTSAAHRAVVVSGLHGDEPKSVLSLVELLQSGYFNRHDYYFMLIPVFNDRDWPTHREWKGRDLNRQWGLKHAPDFIMDAAYHMLSFAFNEQRTYRPPLFIDYHDDVAVVPPYIFDFTPDTHRLVPDCARTVGLDVEGWDSVDDWYGDVETFLRASAHWNFSTTIEVTGAQTQKQAHATIRATLDYLLTHYPQYLHS